MEKKGEPTRASNAQSVIRVFVASPADVHSERDRVHRIVEELNEPNGLAEQQNCRLQILDWRDVVPGMGRPEDVILDQLPVEFWDVVIGILWTRFGTPSGGRDAKTGRDYSSGTHEEFLRAYDLWNKSGKPEILFYRRDSKLPNDVDIEQLAKVRAFWKEFDVSQSHPGLVRDYSSVSDFERFLRNDLTKLLPRLMSVTYQQGFPRAEQVGLPESTKPSGHAESSAAVDETFLNLPPKGYRRLVGREKEIEQATGAIYDPEGKPVVAVVGLGGLGKTALAREVVEVCRHSNKLDHLVWASAKQERFVAERSAKTGVSAYAFDDLLTDIGRQCGQPDIAAMSPKHRLQASRRILETRRVLVVMDNLETVSHGDMLIEQMSQILGKSKLLITSRHLVKHDYAFVIKLRGLGKDDAVLFVRQESAERNIDALVQCESAKLVEIHKATGGAPLAMKLVAGQMSRLPMAVVLADLKKAAFQDHNYQFYRFVYRHSWELLEDTARILLVDLSVFPPTTGGTVADVQDISQVDKQLFWAAVDQLVTMSLVDKTSTAGHDRFALHPLTHYFVLSDITREWEES